MTTPSDRRPLGRSALSTAPMILGCNTFGWTTDEPQSHAVLDAFVDAGFNMIDTADVYGAGAISEIEGPSELIIGAWFAARGRRDDVVLASKVGMWPKRPGLRAARIVAAVEDSLRRLRTDYLDLYQSHQDDPATPQEESLEAHDRLVRAGKVRAIGASNFSAARLGSALDISESAGLARYDTLQIPYSLIDRAFEDDLQAMCVTRDVGAIPYYGIARGFLTGKYRTEADLSKSPRGEGNRRFFTEHNFRVLGALDAAAAQSGLTQGQLALAWVAAQPGVTAPIVSATSGAQLDEALNAVRLPVEPAILDRLTVASRVGEAASLPM